MSKRVEKKTLQGKTCGNPRGCGRERTGKYPSKMAIAMKIIVHPPKTSFTQL
jgi:hypothetical protein